MNDLPTIPLLTEVFHQHVNLDEKALQAVAKLADEGFVNISLPHLHGRACRGLNFKKAQGTVILCLPWPLEAVDIEVMVEGQVGVKDVNDVVQGFREELERYKTAA